MAVKTYTIHKRTIHPARISEVIILKLTQRLRAGIQQVDCPSRLNAKELLGGVQNSWHNAGTHTKHIRKKS